MQTTQFTTAAGARAIARAKPRVVRARLAIAGALVIAAVLAVAPSAARASQLVDRNVSSASLAVNARGVALVRYQARGRRHHVLYWNGINRTKRFRHDRSGGWKSRVADWRSFDNACGRYRGPQLYYVVTQCTAPDGSHWVLQEWQRIIPNYGGTSGPRELRLSHFRGDPARLWIATDWSWRGRYMHLYGQYLYQGKPVYGHRFRPDGYVLDQLGRNVAIDSYNSDYGEGWRRVNMFLSHYPSGQFCFGFAPKGGSPHTGRSSVEWYRASVAGPGVSPDVFTLFRGIATPYDPQFDEVANYWQLRLAGGDSRRPCGHPN